MLYEFDPLRDLRGELSREPAQGELEAIVDGLGRALRALHSSALALPREEGREDRLSRWRAAARRIARALGGGLAERVARLSGALEERAAALAWEPLVPSHADLGFDSLWRDGAGMALYRFDGSRRAHRGVDLGSLLADLLRFHRIRRDRDADRYERLRARLLAAYAAPEPGPDAGQLAVFVAGALLLRVDRLLARRPAKRERKVERLLDHCERELAGEGRRRG